MVLPIEESVPLSRQIAEKIRQQIDSGEYPAGTRLPPQRELSANLGVSRVVLREALVILETAGLLHTTHGSGSYIAETTSQLDRAPNRQIGTYSKLDICRFRLAVEGACARMAAMRITDEELSRLEENFQAFKEQTRLRNFDESAVIDEQFHYIIVQIAGVRIFTDFYSSLRPVLVETLTVPLKARKNGWEPVVEHERILTALKRRDPDDTVYYLLSHLTRSAERLGYVLPDEIL